MARISRSIRTAKGYIRYCRVTPVLYMYRKPSRNTPREWLLMTRHVVDINLAYTITKRKIYTNVEYNFHDRCTCLTLQSWFFFSRQIIFMISARNSTVSTNSKQVTAACDIHAV